MGPAICTERLLMNMHQTTDLDDSAAMWGNRDVTRYISGGKTDSRSESWARILRLAGSWSLLGFGYWAIREISSGRFVGQGGFADPRREIVPSLDGIPEAGWVLAPWAHGKGYATEAVLALVAWADINLTNVETVCLIQPENTPSLRVAEKAGYVRWGLGSMNDGHTTILRRLRQRRAQI